MTAREGIDVERVSRFFREQVPGGDCELEFELIAGGRSNLTYRVSGGDRQWALRRPPLGHVLPTAHDMSREFRVLSALKQSAVPAPRTLALCTDAEVCEVTFYVMEFCDGVVLQQDLPPGFAEKRGDRQRIGHALVDSLVQLHDVDYRSVGLADFGRPDGYLERQVRRWSKQWQGNKTGELPEIDELLSRLGRALPRSGEATIVHGDFRLGNMALDPDDPGSVIAIFDWEMATLGDPLADLGYTLISWVEAGEAIEGRASDYFPTFTAAPGFPTRAEIVERYALESGRDVDSIDFYQVLALTKLAVISEGIYKRFSMGKTLGDSFHGTARATQQLATRALVIARASPDKRLRGTAH